MYLRKNNNQQIEFLRFKPKNLKNWAKVTKVDSLYGEWISQKEEVKKLKKLKKLQRNAIGLKNMVDIGLKLKFDMTKEGLQLENIMEKINGTTNNR